MEFRELKVYMRKKSGCNRNLQSEVGIKWWVYKWRIMDIYSMVIKNVNLVLLFFMNHMLRKSNRHAIYSSQDDKKLEQNYDKITHMRSHWQKQKTNIFRHTVGLGKNDIWDIRTEQNMTNIKRKISTSAGIWTAES